MRKQQLGYLMNESGRFLFTDPCYMNSEITEETYTYSAYVEATSEFDQMHIDLGLPPPTNPGDRIRYLKMIRELFTKTIDELVTSGKVKDGDWDHRTDCWVQKHFKDELEAKVWMERFTADCPNLHMKITPHITTKLWEKLYEDYPGRDKSLGWQVSHQPGNPGFGVVFCPIESDRGMYVYAIFDDEDKFLRLEISHYDNEYFNDWRYKIKGRKMKVTRWMKPSSAHYVEA